MDLKDSIKRSAVVVLHVTFSRVESQGPGAAWHSRRCLHVLRAFRNPQ